MLGEHSNKKKMKRKKYHWSQNEPTLAINTKKPASEVPKHCSIQIVSKYWVPMVKSNICMSFPGTFKLESPRVVPSRSVS